MKRALLLIALLLPLAGVAFGGGPLVVATDGVPVGWDTATPVLYHTDQGGLGLLSNSSATELVNQMFTKWQDVPTATIDFQRAGTTQVDIDVTNFGRYLGPFGGFTTLLGQSVIVFDANGAIFDLLYGVGNGILGFASPTFSSNGQAVVPIGGKR